MSSSSMLFRLNSILNTQRGLFAQRLCIPHFQQYATLKKPSLEEKLGYEIRPKRPLTPYFRYLAKIRPQLLQENPKAKFGDISKLAASKWEKVDPQLKTKLEEEYKKEHEEYINNKVEYEKNVTAEQKDDIKQFKANQKEMNLKRNLKKQMRELGKPKKPSSAFFRFLKAQAPQHKGDLNFKDWQLKAGDMWAKLDIVEKQKLLDEVNKELLDYRLQVNSWEEKMIRLGHVNLVRSRALIQKPVNRTEFPSPRFQKPNSTE